MSQNSADIYFLEGDITNQSYQVASYENKFVQYSKIKILKKNHNYKELYKFVLYAVAFCQSFDFILTVCQHGDVNKLN